MFKSPLPITSTVFSENILVANKYYVSAIEGLNDDDVRLNKRNFLSSKRLRGFQRGKVGPKDDKDHVGGNYAAAVNFEMSLPKLLPDSTNLDVGLFLDLGNQTNHLQSKEILYQL